MESTFSPISDLGLAKAADSPLQAAPALSHNSCSLSGLAWRARAADGKLATHSREELPRHPAEARGAG